MASMSFQLSGTRKKVALAETKNCFIRSKVLIIQYSVIFIKDMTSTSQVNVFFSLIVI